MLNNNLVVMDDIEDGWVVSNEERAGVALTQRVSETGPARTNEAATQAASMFNDLISNKRQS